MYILAMILASVLDLSNPCYTNVLSCLDYSTKTTEPVGEEIRGLAHHSAPSNPIVVVPTIVVINSYEGNIDIPTAESDITIQIEVDNFIKDYVYGNPTNQESIDMLNGLSPEALAVIQEIGLYVENGGVL